MSLSDLGWSLSTRALDSVVLLVKLGLVRRVDVRPGLALDLRSDLGPVLGRQGLRITDGLDAVLVVWSH